MKYKKVKKATFLNRPNRFVAYCMVDGQQEKVHVCNTGRCKELLVPNATVYLVEGENPARSTKYDLMVVEKQCEDGQNLGHFCLFKFLRSIYVHYRQNTDFTNSL